MKKSIRCFWIGCLVRGLMALIVAGCASPEDGRQRGGGPGADGGNYSGKTIHVPSKLDGTKVLRLNLQTDQEHGARPRSLALLGIVSGRRGGVPAGLGRRRQ